MRPATIVDGRAPADDAPPATDARGRTLFALFAALFCAGGAIYSLAVLGDALRFPDERDYLELAGRLAALEGYSFDGETPSAHRPPGYPFALAPLVALSDSVHAVRIAQFALLAVSAWLLGALVAARTGVSRWQGASLVLLGVLCYPVLVYSAGTVFPQTLLLAVLTLLVAALATADDSLGRAALVGALAAAAAEISPTTLVALPLALLAVAGRGHGRGARVLVAALAAALLIGGWVARNLVVLGEPIVFSQNLGENIDNAVLAHEPLAPGELRPPDDAIGYGLDRLAQYAAEPFVYAEHVLDFFAWRNELHVVTESTPARDTVMFLTYHALLLAVLARLVLARRAPLARAEWLVLGLYLGTALFHALVIPRIRYRLPFDFLLLLPAANALLLCLRASGWRSRRRASSPESETA